MTQAFRIALATPHARYDALETGLRTEHGFEVLRVRAPAELTEAAMTAFGPSHVFFPHWSWKIPTAVFERFECVVFHMTDLPFGRGGSPLQNLVVRGIENTQLTALRCIADIDAGPIYLKRPLSTLGTAEEVFLRAAKQMQPMIVDIVRRALLPAEQSGEVVPFKRRAPAEGNLLSASGLEQVHDMIRMLDAEGYPRAFLEAGNLRFEFTRSSCRHDHLEANVHIRLIDPHKEPT